VEEDGSEVEEDGSEVEEEVELEEEVDESEDEMEACDMAEHKPEDGIVESEEQSSEQYKAQVQVKGDVQFREYPSTVPLFWPGFTFKKH
jgi:hypothetical protein